MNERELLAEYRPWLRKVAVGMTSPQQAEDLAQEGWIALWRALRAHDASKSPQDYWLKTQAHRRMLTVVRNWGTTTNAQHVAIGDTAGIWEQLQTELPELENAYHHGQICAALAALTPREREYVQLRFWGDLRGAELKAHFGYQPHALWRTAKPKLEAALSHLREQEQDHHVAV